MHKDWRVFTPLYILCQCAPMAMLDASQFMWKSIVQFGFMRMGVVVNCSLTSSKACWQDVVRLNFHLSSLKNELIITSILFGSTRNPS